MPTTSGAFHRMSPRLTRRWMASSLNPSVRRSADPAHAWLTGPAHAARAALRSATGGCDAGSVRCAAATARWIDSIGTGASVKVRTVRRPVTADARASPGAQREQVLVGAAYKVARRTGTTAQIAPGRQPPGAPVLPLTRSAAERSHRPTAVWVISGSGVVVGDSRRSTTGVRPSASRASR